jgi:hypothetical protein
MLAFFGMSDLGERLVVKDNLAKVSEQAAV